MGVELLGRGMEENEGGRGEWVWILVGVIRVEEGEVVMGIVEGIGVGVDGVKERMLMGSDWMMGKMGEEGGELGVGGGVDVEVIVRVCWRGDVVVWKGD